MSEQNKKRNKLERWLDKHNHFMELVRTVHCNNGPGFTNLYFNEYSIIKNPVQISLNGVLIQ